VLIPIRAVVAFGLILGTAACGYALGTNDATSSEDAARAEAKARTESFNATQERAHRSAEIDGIREGLSAGRKQGELDGRHAGSQDGRDSAAIEAERVAAEQAAAEAEQAAAEAATAEPAVPAPCAHLPPSTARNMCIGAVEAGYYP